MVSNFFHAGALAASLLLFSTAASAQRLVLRAPLKPISLPEGDDFAEQVLQNPWDFEERRDLGWEQNFDAHSIVINDGKWIASNRTPGGYVFPLFPGFKGSLFADPLPGDRTLPRLGINHRINTKKYNYLSFRLLQSDRSSFAVYWESDESKQEYWPGPESPRAASFDGFFHWNTPYQNTGYNVYSFDLEDPEAFEQRQGTWSGDVFALRLDPSVLGAAGSSTAIDWIRLVDPDSAPQITIGWESLSISPFHIITVFLDSSGEGFDGTPIARFTSGKNPGSYTFPSAMLPPGRHYFYVSAQEAVGGILRGAIARSGYSAPVTINAKPQAVFTAPSRKSGSDFAESEVGNSWNMANESDLANLDHSRWGDEWRQFSEPQIVPLADAEHEGLVFQALADPPLPGRSESDVQIHLNVPVQTPINTNRYRYLSYRMRADSRDFPSIHDKVERGWVSRPVFWNSDIIEDAGSSKAHVVYEDWHSYSIDLWDSSIIERGIPWRAFPTLQHFRIDPLEVDVSTRFEIDWVRLTEEPRAKNNRFEIRWLLSDSDDRDVSVKLYYDKDKSGFNGTHIKSFRLSPGEHRYLWNTSHLDPGQSYYLYALVSDGTNSSANYSSVPLRTGPPPYPTPRQSSPPFDFDGDGASDPTVYRAAIGTYFNRLSASNPVAIPWGGPSFSPFFGDFDGDGTADRGLRTEINGYLYWYANRSSDAAVYHPVPWGFRGDVSVIADYNGNGRDELAVYRNGAWFLLNEAAAPRVQHWGIPGDLPVPADYDGDHKADVAVWRPTDGSWWIISSGFSSKLSDSEIIGASWGLAGDIPVPADWSGDGRSDPAVYRPSLGMWFVYDIALGTTFWTQWGMPGDIPIVGDFDGDGTMDFSVWRESDGSWYINHRDGRASVYQFGLAGDLLPKKLGLLE